MATVAAAIVGRLSQPLTGMSLLSLQVRRVIGFRLPDGRPAIIGHRVHPEAAPPSGMARLEMSSQDWPIVTTTQSHTFA